MTPEERDELQVLLRYNSDNKLSYQLVHQWHNDGNIDDETFGLIFTYAGKLKTSSQAKDIIENGGGVSQLTESGIKRKQKLIEKQAIVDRDNEVSMARTRKEDRVLNFNAFAAKYWYLILILIPIFTGIVIVNYEHAQYKDKDKPTDTLIQSTKIGTPSKKINPEAIKVVGLQEKAQDTTATPRDTSTKTK